MPRRSFALGGTASFDVAAGQTLSVAGVDQRLGALAKSNSGTLVLLGANSYQGGTTINGGALSVANDGGLGNSSGTVTINSGILEIQGNATSNLCGRSWSPRPATRPFRSTPAPLRSRGRSAAAADLPCKARHARA